VSDNIDVKSASKEAVKLLQIDDFIKAQKKEIFERLEKGYRGAANRPDADLLFIAESLPLISAIVNVGSSLSNFKQAADWVRQTLPEAEPVSALSALTFIYVVGKGHEAAQDSGDMEKKNIWTKMQARVDALLTSQQ
jgi:hypothetical protein